MSPRGRADWGTLDLQWSQFGARIVRHGGDDGGNDFGPTSQRRSRPTGSRRPQPSLQHPGPRERAPRVSVTAVGDQVTAQGGIDPDPSAWDAWRPEEVNRLLAGVRAPWYVAAGWAIDLFLGGQRRDHEDLEIAAPQARFDEIAHALSAFEIFVIDPPRAWPLLEHPATLETHQTWVREPATGLWRLDVFREPSDGDTWICRRDATIRMPYERLIERTADGIPYGRPEVVLLYKAKHTRPKDDADFAAALPRLEPDRRRWLRNALVLVHPGHRWLGDLA
jgi:hypothetical protein